jgi:hypothetical protein
LWFSVWRLVSERLDARPESARNAAAMSTANVKANRGALLPFTSARFPTGNIAIPPDEHELKRPRDYLG